ncbi:phosphoserine phosphatase SerB [Natronosalvus caseinilyticus]|uniref:phosphoserine phosphatase SerB n=1 Tax=Natronosalvus caseinilyticus TaxID=2953747 RepID=UPI0028A84791|nr:phosphoserine phosphatase SerB [Natronosalvus caseinilyticus]
MRETIVAFDFDGTLSDSEMTVLLGDRLGVADEMTEITERAMNDEIGYAESLRSRAALLEGLERDEVEAAYASVVLREGAAGLIRDLNEAGITTAILTGGFQRGVEAALERDGTRVDHVVSNRLPLDADGEALTGDVKGPLIEGTKDDALANLAETVDVPLKSTVAVGDGANDLPMLRVAGLAIGFDPKPAVEPHCDVVVTSMDGVRSELRKADILE